MINILRRLVLIAKSWLHALTASAEDPRQDFAVAYRRQRELLQKVRHAQGKIGLSQATLQERITDSRQNLAELQGRARQALEDGREDLARFALQLKLGTERDVTSLEDDLAQLDHEEQVLVMIERRLTSQIDAFIARQEVLEAQFTTAEAHVNVQEALGGVSEELVQLGDALEKAERRTEHMQSRAVAIDSLVELGILEIPTPSTDPPALVEGTPALEVEEQLAELRQQLAAE